MTITIIDQPLIAARLSAITQRRADLAAQRTERTDPDNLTLSPNERRAYEAETARIDAQIAAFESAVGTVAALPSLEPDVKWRDFLTESRATLNAELLAIRAPIRDDATRERARALGWAIELIDHGWAANRLPAPIIDLSSSRVGELMAAAGYDVVGLERLRGPNGFRGSLPDVEQRIKELTAQRTAAQAALDSVLMTDEERATVEAERAELAAAFNAMRVKIRPDGVGYVAYTDEGDVLDVSEMTDIQKRAFEWQDTDYRREQQERLDRQLGQG